jgi:DNA-binding MarR family transcriptional regulator
MPTSSRKPTDTALVTPQMRILWTQARERIHEALADSEFRDIRAEHLSVLQYPGPEGVRASDLATRAGLSRQAINHQLRVLEDAGYVERGDSLLEPGLGRVVTLTDRGREAIAFIQSTVGALEREWSQEIGERRFDALRAALRDLVAARSGD